MDEAVDDYEQVSIYPLDDDDREALLKTHAECSFVWSTRDGHPLGVIMSYLWQDGRFRQTARTRQTDGEPSSNGDQLKQAFLIGHLLTITVFHCHSPLR